MKTKNLIFFTLFILFTQTIFAQQTNIDKLETIANRIVVAFNAGNFTSIQNDFSKEMLNLISLEQLSQVSKELVKQYGQIQKIEKTQYPEPNTAIFITTFEKGLLDMVLVVDDQNKIIGLRFTPHVIPTEKNINTLSLPFKGSWFVVWGGDTVDLNYHHDTLNQRFAFDFLIIDEKGKTFINNGNNNEDYYAFGKEIISPADGVVIEVINGVIDNKPHSMNPYIALGNAVLIQHSEKEISILAHLKYGSIKVQTGDKIKRGQLIGLCGNSGNSSEPHLHYHLQNNSVIQDGVGIKCYFQNITVIKGSEKENKLNYSPIKGEIISIE